MSILQTDAFPLGHFAVFEEEERVELSELLARQFSKLLRKTDIRVPSRAEREESGPLEGHTIVRTVFETGSATLPIHSPCFYFGVSGWIRTIGLRRVEARS